MPAYFCSIRSDDPDASSGCRSPDLRHAGRSVGVELQGRKLKLQNQCAEFGAEFCQILVFFIQKHQDDETYSDSEK